VLSQTDDNAAVVSLLLLGRSHNGALEFNYMSSNDGTRLSIASSWSGDNHYRGLGIKMDDSNYHADVAVCDWSASWMGSDFDAGSSCGGPVYHYAVYVKA